MKNVLKGWYGMKGKKKNRYLVYSKDEIGLRINNFEDDKYIGMLKLFSGWLLIVITSFIVAVEVLFTNTAGFYQKYAYTKNHPSNWLNGYKKVLAFYVSNIGWAILIAILVIIGTLILISHFTDLNEKQKNLLYDAYHEKCLEELKENDKKNSQQKSTDWKIFYFTKFYLKK